MTTFLCFIYGIGIFAAPFVWYRFNMNYKWVTKNDDPDIVMFGLAFVFWPIGLLFLAFAVLKAHHKQWLPDGDKPQSRLW